MSNKSSAKKKQHIISYSDYLLLVVSNVKLYWWSLLSVTNLTKSSLLQYGKTQLLSVSRCNMNILQFYTSRFYRPQRSCEGYVFTGVCLSTGGGGVCLSAWWDTTPRSRHPPEQTPPGPDTPPRADTPQSRHPWEQTPPVADTPLGPDPPGADTPLRYGHCWGRYASYWNAFLFLIDLGLF